MEQSKFTKQLEDVFIKVMSYGISFNLEFLPARGEWILKYCLRPGQSRSLAKQNEDIVRLISEFDTLLKIKKNII